MPIAPGEVPVIATGLPGHEVLPHGRAPQSMALLSTAGIERLCSGVTMITPSAASISALKRLTLSGSAAFKILVVERQVVDPGDLGVELVAPKLADGLRELAVDRFAAVAADNEGDIELCHGDVTLSYELILRLDR